MSDPEALARIAIRLVVAGVKVSYPGNTYIILEKGWSIKVEEPGMTLLQKLGEKGDALEWMYEISFGELLGDLEKLGLYDGRGGSQANSLAIN